MHAELPPAKLRWRCEPERLPFETTAQAEPREGFIGQERALRALKMGVELSAPGYNVFVCGLAGTSRGGTIAHMIEELHPQTKPSLDRCYVNNFKITDRPRLLSLPRGQANGFKKDMQAGIDFLRRRIPQVFAGVRRGAVPAAKGKNCRAVHGARKGVDGRFHAADRARAVCAGAHAGGGGGAAGNFSGARRTDGADRRYFQDGARGQAGFAGGGGH